MTEDVQTSTKPTGALASRLLISALLIPGFIGLFVVDHKLGTQAPLLLLLCVLLAVRGTWEMTGLLQTRAFNPNFVLTAICSVAVAAAGWWDRLILNLDEPVSAVAALGPVAITFAVSVLVIFFAGTVRYRQPGQNIETLGSEILIVAYVGLLLSLTAQLRWVAGPKAGYLALGSLVIAAKLGDTAAYTFGRLFGRKKLVPRLSPGKTWMGAFGAVVGASIGSILWLQIATPMFNSDWQPCAWYWALLYGIVIGIVGLIGDLAESLIKRDVEQKDAAALMPGFGGLLDLLDSILYAGPVAYLLWLILPLATWQ